LPPLPRLAPKGRPPHPVMRLGCLARARDPLTIITARVVRLLPVVEQELPRLVGYSRHRGGIRQF
jgi:hypothetical protein